jgi:acyl-coenzyme A thioesterase PaaI-like protein
MPNSATSGARLFALWTRLSGKPGGPWLFSRLLCRMVPYTGTIHPRVEALCPGYARVVMRDRRGVRNHLHSVHAIAIMNLAEVTSGLAMLTGLPDDARAIVTGLSIEYVKKARGTLTAECRTAPVEVEEEREHRLEAVVRDRSGDIVARATARWLVGPRTSPSLDPARSEAARPPSSSPPAPFDRPPVQ